MTNKNINNSVNIPTIGDSATQLSKILGLIGDNKRVPIISLDEALSSLHVFIPELERMISIVKTINNTSLSTLNADESRSILLYSMKWTPVERSFNAVLNTALHKRNLTILKPWLSYLKLFMTAISKLTPNPTHLIIYHAVKCNLIAQYPLGRTLVWWSFSLCTSTLSTLNNDKILGQNGPRTLFIIDTQSAKDIRNHSFHPREIDFLLPSASQLQVTGTFIAGNGLEIIHLKEIQSVSNVRETSIVNNHVFTSQDKSKIKISNRLESQVSFSLSNNTSLSRHLVVRYPVKKSIETVLDEFHPIPKTISPLLKQTNPKTIKLIQSLYTDPMLVSLDVSRSNIGDDEVKVLIYALQQNNTLTTLNLQHNLIGPRGALYLANALKANTTLTTINLANNCISDQGVHYLADALLLNKTLTTLNLRENQIRSQGSKYLSNVLEKNQTLTKLNLQSNHVGHLGASYLANALLKNQTLTTIHLGNNQITVKGAQHLANVLKINKTLTTLVLDSNEIESVGAQYLADALHQNKTLTSLNIRSNGIGITEKQLFTKIMKDNPIMRITL